MKINVLKYTQGSVYYNMKSAKLTPNALKIIKKCEFVNFKSEMVSMKIPRVSNTSHKS